MKAILVAAELKNARERAAGSATSLEELWRLAETADVEPVKMISVRLAQWNAATLIGSGKVEEIKQLAAEAGAGALIFDEDLTPAQQRNLERETGLLVIDRTRLIIEIFALRARTREGILQTRLAKFSYALSRIAGKGTGMDQQRGVIGGRGSGEKKIEYDRRTLRVKISELEEEIDSIKRERRTQRGKRDSVPMPQVSIVGYTNAGKSTLLNYLTGNRHAIYADDKLFATLDPSTKRVRLPSGGWALFTDTVGFIQKLPHALVASFRATLDEISYSDLILHVHDFSSPDAKLQHEAVKATLQELGAREVPVINVFNKADLVKGKATAAWAPERLRPVFVSALTGNGVAPLLAACERALSLRWGEFSITVPPGSKGLIKEIYASCLVMNADYAREGVTLKFKATPENYARITKKVAAALADGG
ncbi:MAG TPA: GTPase HflX [Elusimicrobia bacterium]|nr:MAG: GTPase HflX [Elusimicrobia bacterium GWF2_62_30]HBA61169.1 GTPase HflX [Elusimicrobiota bacterium]